MEFLKPMLGEELYKQVTEKISGKVKLADLNSGNYVEKKDFDDLQETYNNDKQSYEAKFKDMENTTKLKLAVINKVHDVDLIVDLMKKDLADSDVEFDEKDNFAGKTKEIYDNMAKNKPFLFKTETPNTLSGVKPADGISNKTDSKNEESIGERLGRQQSEANKTNQVNPYFK